MTADMQESYGPLEFRHSVHPPIKGSTKPFCWLRINDRSNGSIGLCIDNAATLLALAEAATQAAHDLEANIQRRTLTPEQRKLVTATPENGFIL